jgi:hypothetical protein
MKTCNEKMTLTFLLSRHHILIKCTINIWLQLFTCRIWNNILLLHSITNNLRHLVIDFLVANDKISFNGYALFLNNYRWACSQAPLKWISIKHNICLINNVILKGVVHHTKPPIGSLMNTHSLLKHLKKIKLNLEPNHPITYPIIFLFRWGPTTTLNH